MGLLWLGNQVRTQLSWQNDRDDPLDCRARRVDRTRNRVVGGTDATCPDPFYDFSGAFMS